MGIFNVEDTVERVVTGMHDEVIWKIVSKLGGAIAKQFQDHARAVAIASVASVPLYVSFRYLLRLHDHVRSEREWEKKCNLSLVSAQLWVPVTAEELPAPQEFRVPLQTPSPQRHKCFSRTGSPVGHNTRSSDEHPGSAPREARRKPAILSVAFSCDSSGAEEPGEAEREEEKSESPVRRAHSVSVSVSGVAKRTLWQKDIWKIGVLRDKRMHRAVITAAERTTPEMPFVTEFLQDSDTWYVMNAIVNELSTMCGVQHLSAMQRREMYKDADAYVIALMVPRLGADVKREFMGEEFCDTSTCITNLRVIVVNERDLVKIATQQLVLQEDAPCRFKRRWDVISMMADKYRRFEACKILRHAIIREEGDLDGASVWEVSRSLKREVTPSEPASSPKSPRRDRAGSGSAASERREESFARRLTASLPLPSLRPSRGPSKAEQQRVREISKDQFLQAGGDLGVSRPAAERLFSLLDIDGDEMLSVDEVDQFNRKASHGRSARPNYVSMHLQRVFLPPVVLWGAEC